MIRVLLVFLLIFGTMNAQPRLSKQIGKVVSIEENSGNEVLIKADNAIMKIQAYTDEIIRVRVAENKLADDFSYAVVLSPRVKLTKESENKDFVIWSTSSVKVKINKNPLYISFYNEKNELINSDDSVLRVSWMGTEVVNYKKLFADEKFIGLGEKTGGLNKRGNAYQNWNSDVPGYGLHQDPLYATIPFYIGIHGRYVYGIFLDNTYRTYFNFGASTDDRVMSFGAADGELNYYYIAGKNVAQLIKNYTELTGRAQMPPLWSLGYQQCRYSYFPDTELLTIAKTFRDKKIPADVLYLDIHYMDNYKVFTFSPENYPKPKETIDQLKQMGFRTVVIVDPGLKIEKGYRAYDEGVAKGYFARYPDGTYYVGSVWPGRSHFPDFTNPEVRKWWGTLFDAYTNVGIEGIWNDMNEPAAWGQSIPNLIEFNYDGHKTTLSQARNVYGMQMARATYEGMKNLRNNLRSLNITRATYSGGQRYSTIWTGDNVAYDDHMLLGVRLVYNLGLGGFPFAGPDVGGFIGEPSPNLMARWLNIGIYTPFLRNHVAYDRNYREPWIFGKEYEKIFRKMINHRYQMLPYLYSVAYEAYQTGMPVNRTLAIDYTFDENIYKSEFENQYLFGPSILVTPVVSTQLIAKVYLPEGKWYRYSSDELYTGSKSYLVEAPIDDMPVFIKESSIIPMQSVIQHTGEQPDAVLYLHVYAGTIPNSFVYYEDDGITFNFEKGEFYKRIISYDPVKKEIQLQKVEGNYKTKFSEVQLILHGFDGIKQLMLSDNKTVTPQNEGKTWITRVPLEDKTMVIKWK